MREDIAALHERDRQPPTVVVDEADIPGGGQLHLICREGDYEILYGDEQLMSSWASRSEEALATLVSGRLGVGAQRILIGGLGMGFTLAAARSAFPKTATIVVAELVPKVVVWATGALAHIFGNSLDDPRVSVIIRDVHDVIIERTGSLDAILLDVDNGPDGLVSLGNDRLYCSWGLRAIYTALSPGGILAVWSAFSDNAFYRRLRESGFIVEEITIGSGESDEDPRHIIWLATRMA